MPPSIMSAKEQFQGCQRGFKEATRMKETLLFRIYYFQFLDVVSLIDFPWQREF